MYAHDYESVGKDIIEKMIRQSIFTFSFKGKDKVKTLGSASSAKVAPEHTIDTALMFQQFLSVSKTGELSLEEFMSFQFLLLFLMPEKG